MRKDIKIEGYIALLCEGAAEKTIIELLLDNDKLFFCMEDLLEGEVLKCRNAKVFEQKYLKKNFAKEITVLRILDSRKENFILSKAYREKVKVVDIITAPEIEMLIICKEKVYKDYKKRKMKPSDYCKSILHTKNIKTSDFIKTYFKDITDLLYAIDEYKRISNRRNNEFMLWDLLK